MLAKCHHGKAWTALIERSFEWLAAATRHSLVGNREAPHNSGAAGPGHRVAEETEECCMVSQEHVRRFEEIFGSAGEAVLQRLETVSPRLREHVYGYIAGDLYADQTLDVRTRELVVLATLAAQGGLTEQLTVHLHTALDNGASEREVVSVLETVGTYAGVPRALNALFTAADVFATRRRQPSVGRSEGDAR
jgi:4-carboxymuconolactone decarboxylase